MKISQDVYTCNECGKQETLETSVAIVTRVGYISPIANWYKLNKHGHVKVHFCSEECLSLWAVYNNSDD